MTGTDYRSDVDGLRAIAVLIVVLFHLDVPGFDGGFVGVDIFYVISGFVIFRGMLRQRSEGRFSVLEFYRRRARRILPALFGTLLFSLAVGYLVLTPDEYASLAGSALAALFSVSNFYFKDRLIYFGDSARSTPLVHTWSLGVEEQFYLIAPFLLLGSMRFFGSRGFLVGLAGLSLASFAYNLFANYGLSDEEHAFYLPMSRLWEIGAGGLLALAEGRPTLNPTASRALAALGLAGIAASAFIISSDEPFPAFIGLLPVGATFVLILARLTDDSLGGRMLASPPMLFFGRISYSLYLYHWPVIVFAGLYLGRGLSVGEKLAAFLVATALATLSWRVIEIPLRRARTPGAWRRAKWGMAGSAAALGAVALLILATDGLPSRLNPTARALAERVSTQPDDDDCPPVERLNVVPNGRVCTRVGGGGRFDTLLWGDSHAGMLAGELSRALDRRGRRLLVAGMPDCPPLLAIHSSKRKNREECRRLGAHIVRMIESEGISLLILAGRWATLASDRRAPGDGNRSKTLYDDEADGAEIGLEAALRRTLRRLRATGVDIVVVGPVPELDFSLPQMLVRAAHWHMPLPQMEREVFDDRQAIVLETLGRVAAFDGVSVVYPHEVLCDREHCRVIDGKTPLYKDDDHLSDAGVRLVLPPLLAAIRAD